MSHQPLEVVLGQVVNQQVGLIQELFIAWNDPILRCLLRLGGRVTPSHAVEKGDATGQYANTL